MTSSFFRRSFAAESLPHRRSLQKLKAEQKANQQRKVFFEQLEDRRVMATLDASLDGLGQLLIADGTGQNNNLTISASGSNLVITDTVEAFTSTGGIAGALLSDSDRTLTVPFASITGGQVIVNGGNGNDTLTVNLTPGDAIPANGITFNGGGPTTNPGDKLNIIGGTPGSVTYNYTNATDGSVAMSAYGAVSYTGLEPVLVDSDVSPTDVTFNLPAGAGVAILEDDTGAVAGQLQLRAISGAAFETTSFTVPTNNLTINATDGDTLQVASSVSTDLTAAGLIIAGNGVGTNRLLLNAANILPNALDVTVNAATFDLAGNSETIDALNGNGIVQTTGGTPTLTLGGGAGTGDFSGVLQNGTGILAITKTGTGSQTISGAAANTYTGLTILDQGNLLLGKTGGATAIAGTLQMGAGNTNQPNLRMLQSNQFAASAIVTTANVQGNFVRFDLLGTNQTLTNISDTVGGLVIQNGGSGIASNVNSILTINNNADLTLRSHIRNQDAPAGTGTLALVKNGAGALTLAQLPSNNSRVNYSGTTTVSSGTLILSGLGDPAAPYASTTTVNAGATLRTQGTVTVGTVAGLTLNGGTYFHESSQWFVWTGALNVNADSTINVVNNGASNQVFFDGGINGPNRILTINNTGTITTGVHFRNGGLGSFSGSLNVNNGEIAIGTSAASWFANTDVTLNGAVLQLGTAAFAMNASGASLRSLNGNGTVTAASTAATTLGLTLGTNNGSGTFTGSLINGTNGTLNLVKTGAGTQILNTNTNTYSGTTTINGGVLEITQNTGLGTAVGGTILEGGTLRGNGNITLAEPFVLASDGTISSATAGTALNLNGNFTTNNNSLQTTGAGDIVINGNLVGGATNYNATLLANTPVAYWRLDETSTAAPVVDLIGGRNGTYTNFDNYSLNQSGALNLDPNPAVQFDGVNDIITVPSDAGLNALLNGDYTIQFWMYKDSEAPDWQRLVGKGNNALRQTGVWEEAGAGKRILFQVYNSAGAAPISMFSNSSVEVGRWYHIAAVKQGGTGSIYINGVLDATTTVAAFTAQTSTDPLTFGKLPTEHTFFPGRLDEIALFGSALSGTTINQLAQAGAATGNVVKQGTGTLTLAGANTHVGGTSVQAGMLVAANSSALGTAAQGTTVFSGATLGLSGGVNIADEDISLQGTGAGSQPGALVNLSGNNTIGAASSLLGLGNVGGSLGIGSVNDVGTAFVDTLTIDAPINLQTANLVFNGTGNVNVTSSITSSIVTPTLATLDNFASGTYNLSAGGDSLSARISNDGADSWLLIGRGRQGWQFDTDGQRRAEDVNTNLGNVQGFAPAAFSDALVNELLQQAGINNTNVEIRLRRAADITGTTYQESRWRNFTNSSFTYDFDLNGLPTIQDGDGYPVLYQVLSGPGAPFTDNDSNTNDSTITPNADSGNDISRVFTWAWTSHNNQQGFSYGGTVQGVDNNSPTSFLWENGVEVHAIPYTEVYVRSLTTNVVAPTANTVSKQGTGTVNLSGTSTFTGATTVAAGTLLVNGSISSSAVTVQNGATLGGTGTTGPLTINAGGTHSPGNSPGITVVVGNYTENGALVAEIGTPSGSVPGTDYDQVQVTAGGSVTIGAGATLSVPYLGVAGTFAPAFGQVYTIINNDGTVPADTTGTFTGLAEGALVTVDGKPLRIYYHGGDGNDVVLVSANNPSGTLYVNDQFTVAGPVDGDLEAAGTQTAYVNVNAFATVADALSAYPAFSGNIIVNGGTYVNAFLAGGGNVTLQLVQDLTAGQLDVTLQNISGDATDAIVTRFYNAANSNLTVEQGSFAGVISGSGNLTKTTTNTLSLSGTNTYSGTTAVNAGILAIANSSALGSTAGSTMVADTAQLRLSGGITVTGESITLSGGATDFFGALNSFSGTNTWAGPVLLTTTNARVGAAAGQTLIISGVIADATAAATLNVRAGVGGFVELSGANTYGGATTLVAGTMRIAGADNRLPVGSTLNMGNGANQDFATFDLNGLNQTVGGLTSLGTTMAMTVTNTGVLSTLTVNNNSGVGQTYTGVIAGALNVTKLGANSLTFGGANANTYTGTTTITAGILALGKTAGVNAIPGNVTINGGTLQHNQADQIIDTATITLSSGAVNFHNGTNARNETLAALTMTGGTLGTASNNTVNDVTFTGAVAVSGGAFTVNSGTVLSANSFSLTGGGGAVVGGNHAARESQLVIGAGGLTMQGTQLQLNRSTVTGALGAHLVLNGNVTTLASTTVARIVEDAALSPTFLPRVDLGGAVRSFTVADDATINPDMLIGVIVENGGLTKLGAGQLRLTAANAYTGVTTVGAGQLEINSASGSLTTSPTIDIQGGNFLVTGGANVSTTTVTNGAGTGLLGVDNGTMTVSNGLNVDDLRVGYSNNNPGTATSNPVTGTLTVTGGAATFGSGPANTFLVGHRTGIVNANNNDNVTGTLNLSGATSSTINVGAINLGTVIASGGSGTVSGIVTLSTAGTNTLTATSTLISDSPTTANTGGTGSFLNLGNASNTLNTNTLTVAGMKGRGTVQFQGVGGTFQLNGAAGIGAQTALNVANNNVVGGTGTTSVGIVNTTGGTWNANLSTVLIGRHGQGGAGGAQGTVTIAAGLVTSTGVTLADPDVVSGSTADNLTTGTLNVNGGEFQVNGTITDGDADGSATGGSSVVTINLNGGTLRFNTLSRSTATNTFNVNFNSGTIRTNTGVNQVVTNVPISLLTAGVHNFETDPGRTSTIQTGAPIGGVGSLTKLGTGTLLLQATNTYGGATNVNAGVLQLQNGAAILDTAGAVNVANLATLQLLNNETISSYVGADDIANENDSLLALAGFTLTTSTSATIANVTTANGTIAAGTAILDGDADNNISGTGIFLQAGTNAGTAANPLESTLTNLEANTGSGIFLANTGNLTIGGVTAAAGIVSGGDIAVSAAGSLTVNENVSASGAGSDVTLTTIDAAGAGQDLFVNAATVVSSPGGFIVLNAGDNATITGTLVSGNTVTVNLDSAADAGTASSLSFTGDIDAPLAIFNGFGDTVGDSFNTIRPDQDTADVLTPIQVFGMAPNSNPNGDTLVLDITGLGIPTLTLGPGPRNGSFSFGALAAPLTYNNIENVSTSPALPYHLVLDMRFSGFENGVADTILAQLNAAGTELILDVNAANVFTGPDNVIQSLTIIGSNDNDALTIQETAGGLPKFLGGAPLVNNTGIGGGMSAGSHLNSSADLTLETLRGVDTPWNGDDVTIHFDGGAVGTDSLTVNYTTLNNTGYFSDTNDAGNSGNVLAAPGVFPAIGVPTLIVSFANLEPLTLSGAGGSLLADATGTAATANLTITDLGTTSQIDGDGGFAPTTFSGYSSVAVIGGGGSELIDVISIDSAALTSLNLFGGNTNNLLGLPGGDVADDTLRVRSLPAATSALLQGNAGSDLFQLFDATNTVDNIAGPVVIDGNDGNLGGNTDTLTIVDSGDLSGDTNVVIAAVSAGSSPDYSVDGINPTVGTDVVLRNIDVLNYTSTTDNDQIDGRFENTAPAHDLNTVNLSGWTGADQFLLFTSDQIGGTGAFNTPTGTPSGVANINLFGDALGNPNAGDGNDTFGLTPAGVSGNGAMNVGLVVSDTTRMIRPSASTSIAINGGTPTGLAAPLGDVSGDVLNLDVSALPNTTPVIVSTFGPGTVVAAGIQPLTWVEIEDINLVDQGKLTNVQMGDLFARTTPGQDLVQITRNPTALNPNQVRLRLTATIGNYSASNKTIIYAGGMNDTLTQSNLTIPAEFYGEAGDDYLTGATNNDWLVGGDGNDRINGGQGDNVIWGDNAPTLPTDPQPQDLVAGGDDQLSGLGGNDVFYGGGGNDSVSSGGGNDYAYGGAGNDSLDGHDGDDRLYGGAGNDILSGHSGSDLLSGGANDDKLYGESGNDVLFGGTGADLLDAGGGNDLLVSGSVANESSSWTSVASTSTFNAATYTLGSDNDAALLTLLAQWATFGNRGTLGISPAITHDGANDDLWGGTGDDDFCWETADVLDNLPGTTPPDYNSLGLGMDERFGPT